MTLPHLVRRFDNDGARCAAQEAKASLPHEAGTQDKWEAANPNTGMAS